LALNLIPFKNEFEILKRVFYQYPKSGVRITRKLDPDPHPTSSDGKEVV